MLLIGGWTGDYFQRRQNWLIASYLSLSIQNPNLNIKLYVTEKPNCSELDRNNIEYVVVQDQPNYLPFYDWIRYFAFTLQEEPFIWVDPDVISFSSFETLHFTEDFITYSDESEYLCYESLIKFQVKETFPYRMTSKVGKNFGIVYLTPELGCLIGSEILKYYNFFSSRYDYTLHHFLAQGLPCRVAERFGKSVYDLRTLMFSESFLELFKHWYHLCYVQQGYSVEPVVNWFRDCLKEGEKPTYSEWNKHAYALSPKKRIL